MRRGRRRGRRPTSTPSGADDPRRAAPRRRRQDADDSDAVAHRGAGCSATTPTTGLADALRRRRSARTTTSRSSRVTGSWDLPGRAAARPRRRDGPAALARRLPVGRGADARVAGRVPRRGGVRDRRGDRDRRRRRACARSSATCCCRWCSTPASRRSTTTPWSVDDVAAGIVDKLVARHPHVFADGDATTAASRSRRTGRRSSTPRRAASRSPTACRSRCPRSSSPPSCSSARAPSASSRRARGRRRRGRAVDAAGLRAATRRRRTATCCSPSWHGPARTASTRTWRCAPRRAATAPRSARAEGPQRLAVGAGGCVAAARDVAPRAGSVARVTQEWEFAEHADETETTFVALAARIVDGLLARDPVEATSLGDHRFDDRLPDLSSEGVEESLTTIEHALSAVDQVDDLALGTAAAVDLEILRSRLLGQKLALDTLGRAPLGPAGRQPGHGRLPAARPRLRPGGRAAPPASWAGSRRSRPRSSRPASRATPCRACTSRPRSGSSAAPRRCCDTQLDPLLDADPALRPALEAARTAAVGALDAHVGWLQDALDSDRATRDPRLGPERYAAKLWATLDAHLTPDQVLERAESDLIRIEGEIARAAAEYLGEAEPPPDDSAAVVRRALDAVAAEGPVDDTTVLPLCEDAFADDHRVRPRARPGHHPRRPGRDRRDARDPPRCRGRLLRPARPARDAPTCRRSSRCRRRPTEWDADARRVVLPRVQRAHAAQPHGARGDARPRPAARALAPRARS